MRNKILKLGALSLLLITLCAGANAENCPELFQITAKKPDATPSIALPNGLATLADKINNPKIKGLIEKGFIQEAAFEAYDHNFNSEFALIETALERHLREAKVIEKKRSIGFAGVKSGVHDADIVMLEGGVIGIFKAVKTDNKINNPMTEIFAYRLNRVLELGLVPVTVQRSIDAEQGSLQAFVRAISDPAEKSAIEKLPNFKKMNLFDILLANRDRSRPNLLSVNDRITAIDHGAIFDAAVRPENNNFVAIKDLNSHLEYRYKDYASESKFFEDLEEKITPQLLRSMLQDFGLESNFDLVMQRRQFLLRLFHNKRGKLVVPNMAFDPEQSNWIEYSLDDTPVGLSYFAPQSN